MTRSEVEQAMGETPERDRRNPLDVADYDSFDADGLFVYYDPDDRAIAAECFELGGLSIPPGTSLDLPYSKLIALLRSRDPNLAVDLDGFRSDALGLAGAQGSPESEDKVESILVYRPNYYEDSARWSAEREAGGG
jgi:hypothetical protein